MKPVVQTGDLTLAARPATPETFASFGRLLLPGGRAEFGRSGGVLVSVDAGKPGARRITHMQRYPDAKRVVFAPGGVSLWIVVLGAGDRPAGPPAAFTVPPGSALVLAAGVWHAGPVPLGEGVVVELLETPGVADRFDRKPLRNLVGVEGARVVLPQEPGAPTAGFDLAAPNAVLLDAALTGHLRVAFLAFDGLEIPAAAPALTAEAEQVVGGLRSMWGRVADLGEVPGVRATRELFAGLGIDPDHVRPPSETLLARVLAGDPVPETNPFEDAVRLSSLRMGVPISAYDAAQLTAPILVRRGAASESYIGPGRRVVHLDDRPVLSDREGPFGSVVGDAERMRPTHATTRALVVLHLVPDADPKAVDALLDGVAKAVMTWCGGFRRAHVVVG